MIESTLETTKKALFAAVGAPVVAVKRANDRFEALTEKAKDFRSSFTDDVKSEVASWTEEGEKVVNRVQSQPVVEDIASRIDIDGQVGKLREQLDDLLETWRKNFRPEGAEKIEVEVVAAAPKTAAKKPAAKKPATTSA